MALTTTASDVCLFSSFLSDLLQGEASWFPSVWETSVFYWSFELHCTFHIIHSKFKNLKSTSEVTWSLNKEVYVVANWYVREV